MKTNTFYKLLIVFFVALFTTITISSCDKDDDGTDSGAGDNIEFIGAWSHSDETIVMKADGVFWYYDNYGYSKGDAPDYLGTWTYDSKTKKFTVVMNGRTVIWELVAITKTSITLSTNGKTVKYEKESSK